MTNINALTHLVALFLEENSVWAKGDILDPLLTPMSLCFWKEGYRKGWLLVGSYKRICLAANYLSYWQGRSSSKNLKGLKGYYGTFCMSCSHPFVILSHQQDCFSYVSILLCHSIYNLHALTQFYFLLVIFFLEAYKISTWYLSMVIFLFILFIFSYFYLLSTAESNRYHHWLNYRWYLQNDYFRPHLFVWRHWNP